MNLALFSAKLLKNLIAVQNECGTPGANSRNSQKKKSPAPGLPRQARALLVSSGPSCRR